MEQSHVTAQTIGRQVRKAREHREWSAQRLADEMTAAGRPWQRLMVTKLENGHRQSIGVDDWLALAYVLRIPPVLLLLPIGEVDEVVLPPGVRMHPNLARKWIAGEVDPPDDRRFSVDTAVWHELSEPIRLYLDFDDQLREMGHAKDHAQRELLKAAGVGDPKRTKAAHEQYVAALAGLAEKLKAMLDLGVRPPALSTGLAADMRGAGVDVPDGVVTFDPAGVNDG